MMKPCRRILILLIALVAIPHFSSADEPADALRDAFKIQHEKFIPAKSKPIPGKAICVAKADTDLELAVKGLGMGATLRHSFRHALNGVLVEVSGTQLRRLLEHPDVAFCEQDAEVHLSDTQASPPSWGLDRADQRGLPLDSFYVSDYDGTGIHAYIIDTGILDTHVDFGGRAIQEVNFAKGKNEDCNGHGTHVAGTVGGTSYGVAKNVTLHGVKVLDCRGSGTNSGVISGIDWVSANAVHPAVANMSLGGGASSAVDTAVNNSVAAGIFYAVAAGNSNDDACNYSPARAAAAVSVGSTTLADARSSFSNYGTCVDIFAPGSGITSAWHSSDTAVHTISGTSMASPHVTGAAALFLDENPALTPAELAAELIYRSTPGVISNAGTGSPNLLLFTRDDGSEPPPPPPPPPPPSECTGTLYQATANPGDVLLTSPFTGSGNFLGELICTSGAAADLDLYLDKENCRGRNCSFSPVASSISFGCDESINYSGSDGLYRWRVVHYSGPSESLDLCVNQPSTP